MSDDYLNYTFKTNTMAGGGGGGRIDGSGVVVVVAVAVVVHSATMGRKNKNLLLRCAARGGSCKTSDGIPGEVVVAG